jgi:hypothetical protein
MKRSAPPAKRTGNDQTTHDNGKQRDDKANSAIELDRGSRGSPLRTFSLPESNEDDGEEGRLDRSAQSPKGTTNLRRLSAATTAR